MIRFHSCCRDYCQQQIMQQNNQYFPFNVDLLLTASRWTKCACLGKCCYTPVCLSIIWPHQFVEGRVGVGHTRNFKGACQSSVGQISDGKDLPF